MKRGKIMNAHGDFDMWTDQHVLLAHLEGQWNAETALSYSQQMKDMAVGFQGQPWAHIVYLDDWELGTPDIEAVINELVGWVVGNGLIRTAQVYSPSMIKKAQMDRMVKERVGEFERRVFTTETEAFNWLDQEGFPVLQQRLIKKSA